MSLTLSLSKKRWVIAASQARLSQWTMLISLQCYSKALRAGFRHQEKSTGRVSAPRYPAEPPRLGKMRPTIVILEFYSSFVSHVPFPLTVEQRYRDETLSLSHSSQPFLWPLFYTASSFATGRVGQRRHVDEKHRPYSRPVNRRRNSSGSVTSAESYDVVSNPNI